MNGFHEDLKYNLRADAYRDALRKLKRAQEEEGEIPIIDFLVVANERSKRYYLPSDKSYRRALRQKNLILYDSEELAVADGFSRAGKKRRRK